MSHKSQKLLGNLHELSRYDLRHEGYLKLLLVTADVADLHLRGVWMSGVHEVSTLNRSAVGELYCLHVICCCLVATFSVGLSASMLCVKGLSYSSYDVSDESCLCVSRKAMCELKLFRSSGSRFDTR